MKPIKKYINATNYLFRNQSEIASDLIMFFVTRILTGFV